MADGFQEPKTEDEAKRLKAFLDAGAETSIELVKEFPAGKGVDAQLRAPGILDFAITGDEIRREVGQGADRRVILGLEVTGLDREHDFVVQLLINRDQATDEVSLDDPSLAGTIAFFCEIDGPEGVIICPIDPEKAIRFDLDVSARLDKLESAGDPFHVTLLLIPPTDRNPEVGGLTVGAASVKVVSSVVKSAA